MEEVTLNVNWLAVIVGAIVAYLIGWLWYSPKLFGTKWMEGASVTLSEGGSMPVAAMVVQALGTIMLSWVVGITAAQEALLTIILITLTITVLMISGGLYSQKSSYAIAIEAGYLLVMVVTMILCQGLL